MSFHADRPLQPRLLSFDVFGTLVDTPPVNFRAFRSILEDAAVSDVDPIAFYDYWEQRNIAHYWEPYRLYKEICGISLDETFRHFGVSGADERLISRYFDLFPEFQLYSDVTPTLDLLSRDYRLAVVSNIDDDLLTATRLGSDFDLICTAERAKGYKPDGSLFRYLIDHAGVHLSEILHAGQSQFTDLVGGKPLGLTIAWVNRRDLKLHPSVPAPDFVLPDIASLIALLRHAK